MSKNNVRIAIRDSTDSHNVAFFDNKAGIKYKSANLQRFLAGSASILTIKYNSKDIDSIRSGCKLAFRYKNRDYWLNVMSFEKKGFEVELTAYSLGLELNNETRGEHKPSNAMSIAEYVGYYDPEHALTIGVNEVSDKRIKLEWTGTDTILARLFSVANSFGAELDFSVELNDDYSLKRQVLNIYKKGNLGTNKVSQPVRVGKELKVINYSDNIKELRTAVRATGKDGLTIDGLNKKIYDNNKELLYYSSGMTVYAPQSRDRFPSVGKGSNDNWIVEDLGETQYETKEALWGYLYSEIQKKSLPEITYEVEGAIEAGIGDTQTLIDDIHFEPPLYVQARVSELEDDILTGKVTKSTFINFERKYSQIADILLKQVEALAEDAAPYIVRLTTDNGYIFKNGQGTSTITAKLEKYSKDIAATWKWVVDNKVVGTGDKLTVKAEQVTNTMAVTVIAYVNGNEVVRDYMTFSNSDDGVGVASIDRYFTSSDQSDGVTIEGAEWSDKPPAPTEDGKYLWAYDEITYTDGTVTTTRPAAVGANFDVDAFRAEIAEDLKDVPNREEFENKIAEELANSKAEIETQIETAKTQAESNAKEYADTINGETAKVAELANAAAGEIKADLVNVKNNLTSTSLVANNAQAAVDAAKQELTEVNTKVDNAKEEIDKAKQDLTNVASELNTAKQDLTDSVTAVNNKVDNAKEELTQAKQQITTVADDLSTAKQDFQNAVSAVDTKATNLKSDLAQAKQDLASQAQQLQEQATAQSELTNRVSSVEETANGTKTTVSELSKTVAQNGKDITSVTARTKVVEDDLSGTKTTLSQVKTTADSTSQKTATLETGLNGLSAKFSSLKVGGRNLIIRSEIQNGYINNEGVLSQGYAFTTNLIDCRKDKQFTITACPVTIVSESQAYRWYRINRYDADKQFIDREIFNYDDNNDKTIKTIVLSDDVSYFSVSFDGSYDEPFKIEKGNIATDYSPNEADLEQKVAEYKQTADQNYASLQTTVQNLDGTVQHNKTVSDQTAEGFKTRIESLETYKDGETTRANQYFESAKTETARQLTVERTAIAKDYVAKSTYTSDVTGIRNDLTATTTTANTTKTNLANYQASNDKMVASLKSSLQTTDGNVSNLQTKVEAVPGQITSAVSSVEGKIPTSIGGRNLWIQSKVTGGFVEETLPENHITAQKKCYRISNNAEIKFNIEPDFSPRLYRKVTFSAWVKYENVVQGDNGWNKFNVFKHNFTYHNSKTEASSGADYLTLAGYTGTSDWKYVHFTVDYSARTGYDQLKGSLIFNLESTKSGTAWVTGIKVEIGSIPSDYTEAPEDTASQISSLSSEIKQTADGMTLLATKTELNSAKTDLQAGITTATNKANTAQSTADSAVTKANSAQSAANSNAQIISTHTTQISALNTGLSAKVSQTDFNTLSGRVTTAENNITAKATELSSKITSVEGKIPTNIGTVNLVKDTGSAFVMGHGITDTTWNETKKQSILDFSVPGVNLARSTEILPRGNKFCDFKPIKGTTYTQSIMIDTDATFNPNGRMEFTWFANGQHNSQKGYIKKVGAYSYQVWSTYTWNLENTALRAFDMFHLYNVLLFRTTGTYLAFYKPKLTAGNLPSDWSPSPDDYDDALTQVKSEIKQTADGITLLATKTEVNSAKSELQNGINAAANKANAAQNTANSAQSTASSAQNKANSNAQTISTHTTQISALNTGLQAKVSQSDFNTLSGRVTTAENNITAKANELSSKITSVEGKIPKNAVGTNLYIESKSSAGFITVNSENLGKPSAANERTSDFIPVSKNEKYVFQGWLTVPENGYPWHRYHYYDSDKHKVGNAYMFDSSTPLAGKQHYAEHITVPDSDSIAYIRISARLYNDGKLKFEKGNIASDYSLAPDDVASAQALAQAKSEIKQTADGITLLATKTEVNSAKSELQNGINAAANKANAAQNTANSAQSTASSAQNKANSNAQTISTHTTQISALNTGLQAKVSQSDFNTLSGRVTTAENNITAKANELSSKITSVEGKIPKNAVGTNLYIESKSSAGFITVNSENLGKPSAANERTSDFIPVSKNEKYVFQGWLTVPENGYPWHRYHYYDSDKHKVGNAYMFDSSTPLAGKQHYAEHITVPDSDSIAYIRISARLYNDGKLKFEKGNIASDYSLAPDDVASAQALAQAKSEIKQTADGMTLLATKTELNSAKTELQSGINTATNKANNNAQTISTHTTQISALNTGLQAKVSQSDFNTLSGRVTTAENNITAKANELSSKITSVEGKIPASIGGRNLWIQSKVTGGFVEETLPDNHITGQKKCYRISNNNQLYFNIEPDFSSRLYRKVTFSAWVKYENVVQGDNGWNKFNCFKHELYYKNSSTGATTNVNHRTLEGFTGTSDWKYITYTYDYAANKSYDQLKTSIRFNLEDVRSGTAWVTGVKVEVGSIPSDYTPAPEDTDKQISSLSSEFKQTTDAIKASVSSLDKSTVKSSSLTINSDGIVMKAGKSTTDVANAIGSYFAVNQNAINLFSDKINVKGNMIVSGAITSDKIASKSINTAHLNGKIITADVISSNAVTADAIRAGAVTTDKMSANSINGDRITAGTLDAAKIKAGSITASQIASGTITSNQIKAGGISSANIAAGAITGDKIAAGAIDANKIAANAITANMIKGGQLKSTNGATSFDLNAGTLTFNNDYGYIQRVSSDKVFEITTVLGKDANSQDFLTSEFTIRKSDFSRQAGAKFTLYNATTNKPTARATIHADELVLFDSQNTTLLSILAKGSLSNFNFQDWGDIPVAQLPSCGLMVKDIGIGGYTKSLQKIVEELCRKTGVLWI